MNQSVELMVSKIEELIGAVGGKIEEYYPYVVRQCIVEGIINLATIAIGSIFLYIGLKLGQRANWDENSWHWVACCIAGGVILFFSLMIFFMRGLPQLINPHYCAVKDILEMGRGLIK